MMLMLMMLMLMMLMLMVMMLMTMRKEQAPTFVPRLGTLGALVVANGGGRIWVHWAVLSSPMGGGRKRRRGEEGKRMGRTVGKKI